MSVSDEVTEVEESQTGADAILNADAEIDVNDLAAVEAKSREDAPEEVKAEESEAESPPAVEEDDEKKTDPFQERIDKLTARYRETERSLTTLEQENLKLREKLSEIPESRETPKTLADFEYDEGKYRDYLFTEAEKRAEAVAERAVRGFQKEQQTENLEARYVEKEKAFAETVKDYKAKVYDPDLKITADMAEEIRVSDIGPEVAYYLASNPDEAAEISRLSGRDVTRRMLALEGNLQAEKQKASETVSKAPPPPAKLKGVNAEIKVATTDPKSDKMSDADWFAAEEKRLAKVRG